MSRRIYNESLQELCHVCSGSKLYPAVCMIHWNCTKANISYIVEWNTLYRLHRYFAARKKGDILYDSGHLFYIYFLSVKIDFILTVETLWFLLRKIVKLAMECAKNCYWQLLSKLLFKNSHHNNKANTIIPNLKRSIFVNVHRSI